MKKFIIAMIVLALGVAVLLAVLLVFLLTDQFPSDFFRPQLKLANRQVYQVSEINQLYAGYTSERLILVPGNDDEIVLEEYMSNWKDDMLATVTTDGGKLDIQAGRRPANLLFGWRCHIKLHVPRSFMGRVVLNNVSGSINVEGDFLFDSFEANCSSGTIRIEQLACRQGIRLQNISGSIHADTLTAEGDAALYNKSGSIKPGVVQAKSITSENISGSTRFDSVKTERITAKTSSGGLYFEKLEGAFDLVSSSGTIRVSGGEGEGSAVSISGGTEITLGHMTGNIQMKTSSGSCRLTVPQSPGFAFEAKTSSGSLHTPDSDSLNFNQKGNAASGNLGGGGSIQVKMETTSGSLRLQYQ